MTDKNPPSVIDEMLTGMITPKVKPEILLGELDDLLRNRPNLRELFDQADDAIAWTGRAAAVVRNWDSINANLMIAWEQLHTGRQDTIEQGYLRLIAVINEARHSIRMVSGVGLSVAVESGMVFDYFDGLRKIIERATTDLLFIDPYLDADFVSRYLGFALPGINVRLLAGQSKLPTLLPAVDAFAKQNGTQIAVRSTDKIHDRFVFVDGKECYQSGASFKDGAAKMPTTVTQIADAFPAMLKTYEDLWASAKPER
jgi:hypothetical protein